MVWHGSVTSHSVGGKLHCQSSRHSGWHHTMQHGPENVGLEWPFPVVKPGTPPSWKALLVVIAGAIDGHSCELLWLEWTVASCQRGWPGEQSLHYMTPARYVDFQFFSIPLTHSDRLPRKCSHTHTHIWSRKRGAGLHWPWNIWCRRNLQWHVAPKTFTILLFFSFGVVATLGSLNWTRSLLVLCIRCAHRVKPTKRSCLKYLILLW